MVRYVKPKIKNTTQHTLSVPPVHLVANSEGVPIKPSILAHIAKVVGRKQLAYELGISKTLLDQMLSGEKHDLEWRVRRLVQVAVKHCGPEITLMIIQDLIGEIAGAVQK
jgi:hypothetical protein